MRQIILDTETTGLEYRLGDRVIEIGCLEMVNRRLSGRHFHQYINPERDIDPGAVAVHGITAEFLQDKPRFAEVAAPFVEFIRGAELIIHNAPFDVGFLNHELSLLGLPPLGETCSGVIDTLKLAKGLHPGKRNNLDALCERYGVEHGHRTLHGALLDAELLGEVYLSMTRGQESLVMALDEPGQEEGASLELGDRRPRVLRAGDEELAAHAAVLAAIEKESKGACVWLRLEAGSGAD